MANVRTLRVSLKAQTQRFRADINKTRERVAFFNKTTKKATRSMRGFGRAMSVVKKVAAAAIAIGALARAFHKVLRAGEEFNQAMRQSTAIMGNMSASMNNDLRRTAIAVARETTFSAKQAAESYFFLASAGLNAKQSITALPAVAKFAQAGMFDMAQATDLLTDAQSALGLTVSGATQNMANMRRVSDVLVKANTLANASVQQFSEALTTKAGAALKIVNKDIEEGVAVLAAFADQGIKSSDAGTALNIVFRDMQTKALNNATAFAKAGVAVFDAAGKMRNIADIIADLEAALTGLSDAQKKATLLQLGFSDKSVVFTQTLIGLSEKIRGYEAALRSASGTTDEVSGKMLTSWQKATAKFGAAWTDLGQSMSWVVTAAGWVVQKFADAIAGFKMLGRMVTGTPYMEVMRDELGGLSDESKTLADNLNTTTSAIDRMADASERASRKALKLRVKSREDAKENKLGAAREQLRIDLATPQEKFQFGKNRLDMLFNHGQRSPELYTKALAKLREELDRATGKTKALADRMRRASDIIEEMKTPMEQWRERVAEVKNLFAAGDIPWETARRALDKAAQNLADATGGVTVEARARKVDVSSLAVVGQRALDKRPQKVEGTLDKKMLAKMTSIDKKLDRDPVPTTV